ncbi:mitochondrial 37S ribosomal protein YmS-T, partial [Diplocarpon mali]
MPPKGSSTALQPMRLPPLPKLRVRRPNQAEANPCLAIMSSMLSTLNYFLPSSWERIGCMLGFIRLRSCRVSGFRDAI